MKITQFDLIRGDRVVAVVTEKEEFDRIMKAGLEPWHATCLRTGDVIEAIPQKEVTWDRVKVADELTLMPPLGGG